MTERLGRSFFTRPSWEVARDLIGCVIETRLGAVTAGRIVETEAYGDATDLASHTAIYHRARAGVMARTPGSLYVYRSYGIHLCLNIVAHPGDSAGAVLIRAIEPTADRDLMRARRGSVPDLALGRGPGNTAQALGIQLDMTADDVVVSDKISVMAPAVIDSIAFSTRIGITRDVEREWRFFDPHSSAVSRGKTGRLASGVRDSIEP